MSDAKLGTENIEKVLEGAFKIAVAVKQVAEDKKLSVEDLPAVINLVKEVGSLVEAGKAAPEALEEIKDIDVSEVLSLIAKVDAMVKQVEKA